MDFPLVGIVDGLVDGTLIGEVGDGIISLAAAVKKRRLSRETKVILN